MAPVKTWAQLAFDRLVREHIAPTLKRHGFRKVGLNWFVHCEEQPSGWGIINLQKSSFSSRDRISFTFNLAVTHLEIYRDSQPLLSACEVQGRIGRPLEEPRDLWWSIDGGQWSHGAGPDCLTPILAELMPLLEDHAVPYVMKTLAGSPR